MPNLQTKYAVTVRRGHGSLPIGLKFVNLVRSQGVETIRIRFSLNHDKVLDLPLSADTLAELARIMREGLADVAQDVESV